MVTSLQAPAAPLLAERIANLDIGLFGRIESHTTDADRRALLALHAACRSVYGRFAYLEIGSHRGGSLQALVGDPACEAIVSIDSRPAAQPDERGWVCHYGRENSTARMLADLATLEDADVGKVSTFDTTTADIDPSAIAIHPALCFIDGEHTDRAALSDARFCRRVLADDGAIVFHDAQIVYRAIRAFIDELQAERVSLCACVLPDAVFVLELGKPRLLQVSQVRELVLNNWTAYLWSLEWNDGYRTALNRPLGRALRRLRLLRT
jgi:hypothetical protein